MLKDRVIPNWTMELLESGWKAGWAAAIPFGMAGVYHVGQAWCKDDNSRSGVDVKEVSELFPPSTLYSDRHWRWQYAFFHAWTDGLKAGKKQFLLNTQPPARLKRGRRESPTEYRARCELVASTDHTLCPPILNFLTSGTFHHSMDMSTWRDMLGQSESFNRQYRPELLEARLNDTGGGLPHCFWDHPDLTTSTLIHHVPTHPHPPHPLVPYFASLSLSSPSYMSTTHMVAPEPVPEELRSYRRHNSYWSASYDSYWKHGSWWGGFVPFLLLPAGAAYEESTLSGPPSGPPLLFTFPHRPCTPPHHPRLLQDPPELLETSTSTLKIKLLQAARVHRTAAQVKPPLLGSILSAPGRGGKVSRRHDDSGSDSSSSDEDCVRHDDRFHWN
jgi:hypothetical protein